MDADNSGGSPDVGDASAPARGKWLQAEDEALRQAVDQYGAKNWKVIAHALTSILAASGIQSLMERTDVQCLHRWQKVLKPGLVKVRHRGGKGRVCVCRVLVSSVFVASYAHPPPSPPPRTSPSPPLHHL